MNYLPTRVVCIEDEAELVDLIHLVLTRRGFEVIGALGGKEGLLAVAHSKPDLILLDLMMPDIDGWEVYRQLRANDETRNIPVIVVTSKSQSIDRMLGLDVAGVDDKFLWNLY